MARGLRRSLVLLMVLLAAGALLGPATTALAHVRTAPTTVAEPAPAIPSSVAAFTAPVEAAGVAGVRVSRIPTQSSSAPVSAALILALLVGVTLVAPRQVLVAAFVLVLAVIAAEEGVHSVHHLADQRAASQCAVAAASAHVQGATEPPAVPAVLAPNPIRTVVAAESDRTGSRPVRPDEGRAPPSA